MNLNPAQITLIAVMLVGAILSILALSKKERKLAWCIVVLTILSGFGLVWINDIFYGGN